MKARQRSRVRLFHFVAAGAVLVTLSLAAGPAQAGTAPTDPRVQKAVETVQAAIKACLMSDESAAFAAYLETVHPDRKLQDRAVRDMRRYTWKRFYGTPGGRKSCVEFIRDGDVSTVEVVRVQPPTIPAGAKTFKVYFRPISKPGRSSTPIIFRMDGDRVLIDTNSL